MFVLVELRGFDGAIHELYDTLSDHPYSIIDDEGWPGRRTVLAPGSGPERSRDERERERFPIDYFKYFSMMILLGADERLLRQTDFQLSPSRTEDKSF